MIQLERIKGFYNRERALRVLYPMQMLIIKQGKGVLCMNSGDYDLLESRIFFIPEEGLVRIEGEIKEGYQLSFSNLIYTEFLQPYLDWQTRNLFLNLSFRDLEKEQSMKIYNLLEQLKKEIDLQKDVPFQAQYLSLLLGFAVGLDGFLTGLSTEDLRHVLRFKLVLDQHYKTEKSIEVYARGMDLSPNKLNTFLNKVFGKTLLVLIKERIMREAKDMLLQGEYSVQEVAQMLGFKQLSSFYTNFRRHTGISVAKFSQLS